MQAPAFISGIGTSKRRWLSSTSAAHCVSAHAPPASDGFVAKCGSTFLVLLHLVLELRNPASSTNQPGRVPSRRSGRH